VSTDSTVRLPYSPYSLSLLETRVLRRVQARRTKRLENAFHRTSLPTSAPYERCLSLRMNLKSRGLSAKNKREE